MIQCNSIQCVTYVQVAKILYASLTHDAAARTGSAQFIVNVMISSDGTSLQTRADAKRAERRARTSRNAADGGAANTAGDVSSVPAREGAAVVFVDDRAGDDVLALFLFDLVFDRLVVIPSARLLPQATRQLILGR